MSGTQSRPEYNSFLTKVEDHYKDMVIGSEWHGTVNQGAAFTTTPNLYTQTQAPAALSIQQQRLMLHRKPSVISVAETTSNLIVQSGP
eukprot:6150728-Ditylum_brightwellii.AAC.1